MSVFLEINWIYPIVALFSTAYIGAVVGCYPEKQCKYKFNPWNYFPLRYFQ